MDNRFIYVFTKKDRDCLVDSGYLLLKEDESRNIYVFENKDIASFSLSDIQFVLNSQLNF